MGKLNKMSLLNLDVNREFTQYSFIIGTEMNWLFKGSLPRQVLFIPDAFNGPDTNAYIQNVRQVFNTLNINIKLISEGDPVQLIREAACIAAGGGSLEKLLRAVDKYKNELKNAMARKVPFLGWNEGAVLACPGYVVPDPIPGFPDCLAGTNFQYFVHFAESTLTRNKMKNYLTRSQNATPPITAVYCLADAAGGNGVRLEDDIVAIDYAGNSPVDPTRKFTLNDLS